MIDKKTQEKLEKIKKALSEKNGQIDEQIKSDIAEITKNKKAKKVQDAAKNLGKAANEFDSDKLISDLGTIEPPDVVKDAIKKTMSSLLDPIRASFLTEMARYIDTISTDKTVRKDIPRAVKAKTIKKIENGEFVPTVTGADGEKYVINPEFKQLLTTGYRPSDDNEYDAVLKELNLLPTDPKNPGDKNPFFNMLVSLEEPDIGTPDSEYIKNYLGGDEPGKRKETITNTINIPAGLFIESVKNLPNNVHYLNNPNYKELSLNGFSVSDSETKSRKYNPNPGGAKQPNWTVKYREQGSKYTLSIKNNHEFFINNKITINTSSYSFVGKLEDALSKEARDYIKSDLPECESYNNDELYAELMYRDNKDIFKNSNSVREKFRNFLVAKHPQALQDFVSQFLSSYENNRLLKKFKLPKIKGLDDDDIQKASNLIILNLINFIPEVSQELIDCGKQPHPLNLDQIIDLMTKKFNSMGTQVVPKTEFCSDNSSAPKNPMTEAAGLGAALLIMRLSVLENVLKSLFIFDEQEYSSELVGSSLYNEFVYVKVMENLINLKLYEEIEEIIEENYDFLKENKLIKPEDEVTGSKIESIRINGVAFSEDSAEMKSVAKALVRKTIGYIKKLIGVVPATKQEERIGLLQSMTSNIIYDVVDDQTTGFSKDNFDSSQRLSNMKEKNFLMLERCFIVDKQNLFKEQNIRTFFGERSASVLANLKSRYDYMDGCISFSQYQKFIQNLNEELRFVRFNGSRLDKISYFINNPKIGLRLVQTMFKMSIKLQKNISLNEYLDPNSIRVTQNNANKVALKKDTIKTFKNDVKDYLNNFNFNDGAIGDIKEELIKQKKMYGFYDIDTRNKTINFYNSLPMVEVQNEVSLATIIDNNGVVRNLDNFFDNTKGRLIDGIVTSGKYEVLVNKIFMLNKIPNLAIFYSHCALTNSATETLFYSSKKKIVDFYDSAVNIKNYKHKNSIDKAGGAMAKYQMDVANIGNPSGGFNFDILQFFITTPILILKGITNLMDPNISIASQIVNAAAAGLLFPTQDDNGNLKYPGDPIILPTVLASLALLPVNVLAPVIGPAAIGPPVTPLPGMLFWALEPLLWKLPFFQNQAAKSDAAKKLKNDSSFKGLNIGGEGKFRCDIDQDE